jgi:hypothetical protein
MIKLQKFHVVKEMYKLNANTDFSPSAFDVAVKTKAYDICKTLINLGDPYIENSVKSIIDH